MSLTTQAHGVQTIQRMIPASALALALSACTNMPPNEGDLEAPATLASCPPSPNCVCSIDTDRSHYIAPLEVSNDPDETWQMLLDVLGDDESISIISSDDHYIRAKAKTRLFRFTDDVEFLLNREERVIDMRSSSRDGLYDLGKNRSRLEGIRSAMQRAADP